MKRALELARMAAREGEVPVGAVVAKDGVIVGEGRNMREKGQNALAHAEILAIDSACKALGSWRLDGCDIYVTLEPCPMCTGAIMAARIKTVVFSLIDFNTGAMGGKTDLLSRGFSPVPEVISGICEEESRRIMDRFFKKIRKDGSRKGD